MPTPTYDLIASNVLTSSASSVTFSSISGSYRDLVLVVQGGITFGTDSLELEFNNDSTAGNYSVVMMRGSGSTAESTTFVPKRVATLVTNASGSFLTITHILDSSATDKHKTYLTRGNTPGSSQWGAGANANRWANTAAITSIKVAVPVENFASGTSFYLYGIVS